MLILPLGMHVTWSQPFTTTLGQVLEKVNIYLPWDSAIPVLGIYPREVKAHVHTKSCTRVFIGALLVIAENCPSAGG